MVAFANMSINAATHNEGTTYNNNNTSHSNNTYIAASKSSQVLFVLKYQIYNNSFFFRLDNIIQHHLNKVRHEATRQFRKEKKEYPRAKIEELETKSEIKNIRDPYRASMILRRVNSLETIR